MMPGEYYGTLVQKMKALDCFSIMDLTVMVYKLSGKFPENTTRDSLIELIIMLLNDAAKKLEGQLLPDNIGKIDNLTPRDI